LQIVRILDLVRFCNTCNQHGQHLNTSSSTSKTRRWQRRSTPRGSRKRGLSLSSRGEIVFFLLEPRQSVATIVVDQQAMVIRKIYPNLATNQILSLNFYSSFYLFGYTLETKYRDLATYLRKFLSLLAIENLKNRFYDF